MSDLTITSARNPRVLAAADLRDRRDRARSGRFLIDGVRELDRALSAGITLAEVFACRELLTTDEARTLLARLDRQRTPLVEVAPHVFAKLAYGDRGDGVVAIAHTPSTALDRLTLPAQPLVAVLEACEKPGNLGAVLRSADGAGLSAAIVAASRVDLFNPNVIRASLGTIFSVPLASATTAETLAWLRAQQLQIVTAQVDATRDYTAIDYTRPTAIVLGSEAHGLSAHWQAADILPVRLPMRGIADSLNVAATAAVIFYESLRQRTAAAASPAQQN